MNKPETSKDLAYWSNISIKRVENKLKEFLPTQSTAPQNFNAALHYTLSNPGKRLRSTLVYMTASMLGGNLDDADLPATAIELIHTYSLIHDDLPAMDDDAIRRGQPSCHCAFDEATAILVGDALQTLAFEVLSTPCNLPPKVQLEMIQTLAKASGLYGMCKGQALDIAATNQILSLDALKKMHQCKTGALIEASIMLGAQVSNHATPEDFKILRQFAQHIGLAFQVKDDVLDVIGDPLVIGKPQGSDEAQGKATYTQLLGLKPAIEYATHLCEESKTFLKDLKHNSAPLRGLADYINQRVA